MMNCCSNSFPSMDFWAIPPPTPPSPSQKLVKLILCKWLLCDLIQHEILSH